MGFTDKTLLSTPGRYAMASIIPIQTHTAINNQGGCCHAENIRIRIINTWRISKFHDSYGINKDLQTDLIWDVLSITDNYV